MWIDILVIPYLIITTLNLPLQGNPHYSTMDDNYKII